MRVVSARAGRWVLATLVAAGTIAAIEALVAEGDEFADRRNAMVDALVANGIISDARVIGAMRTVPRHLFVSEAQRDLAVGIRRCPSLTVHYMRPASSGSWSAPAPEASARVLEISAGCGANGGAGQAGAHVYSVEPNAELAVSAQARFSELGITNATVKQGTIAAGRTGIRCHRGQCGRRRRASAAGSTRRGEDGHRADRRLAQALPDLAGQPTRARSWRT